MIFKKISFHQYRCFMDGEISFVSSKNFKKNITLIEAPNGSGKTELLFAFWWVLYGEDFDFKTMQNKEATPYALNSKIYREIQRGVRSEDLSCKVSLEFEHEDKAFLLERVEEYKKTPKRDSLNTSQTVSLSEVNEYGTTSLPNKDKEQIARRLDRIIPKKLLHGIIFDGERMQKISSTTDKAIEGIEGVISDVTSRDLISLSIEELKAVKRKYNSLIKGIAKNKDAVLLGIQEEIEDLTNKIESESNEIKIIQDEDYTISNKIQEISEELLSYEKTKRIEEDYNLCKKELEVYEEQFEQKFDDLYGELSNKGALMFTNKLFEEVEEITTAVNIPAGLNVEAVESILDKEFCICGSKLQEDMISRLKELMHKLPPDNVNSLILETIRHKKNSIKETEGRLQSIWNDMKSSEDRIGELKNKLSALSTQISRSGINGEMLIKERENLAVKKQRIKDRKNYLIENVDGNNKKLKKKEDERVQFNQKYIEVQKVQTRISFVDKSLAALEKIQEKYSERALRRINEKIKDSYISLSEEADYGREVYITQFTNQKYKIVTYYKDAVDAYIESSDWSILKSYGFDGDNISSEIKKEVAILENAISNSTGQSKAVTIAFIKAILDYSMEEKEAKEEFEVQKNYPVVIDAPFGDLSGKNLSLPAKNLNSFSEQVILMLSTDSYRSVKDYIDDSIGVKYTIQKLQNKNYSTIIPEKVGETANGVLN